MQPGMKLGNNAAKAPPKPPAAPAPVSDSPMERTKRAEAENVALRSRLKAAEADLSQKEIDVSCELNKFILPLIRL